MNKTLRIVALALLACMLCITLASCNNGNKTTEPSEIISSLAVTEASTTIKVGEDILLTNFYEIKGTSTLSAAQKACTYESSDPTVVEINGKRAEALKPGTATITITSRVEPEKTCTLEVTVSKTFIDRELTAIPSEDDFTNEWDDATGTGSFRTSSGITNFYYLSDVYSTQWYVETDITVHQVNWDDRWPKIGIAAQHKNEAGDETMVAFYLNATIGLYDYYDENGNSIKGEDNNYWNEFGVSEVYHTHWAWEEGITNSLARHHDYCWNTGDNKITFGTTFKLGVARDGMNFHVYINGAYAGSFQLSADLDILVDENNQPLASHVGFWHYSCDATFSNYMATTDEAKVAEKIPAEPVYCEFLED